MMNITVRGTGNIGGEIAMNTVKVEGEDRKVASFSVRLNRLVRGDGEVQEEGGFWARVNLWGEEAVRAHRHLRKGARVLVEGAIKQEAWKDEKTGEERTGFSISAAKIYPDLAGVENIVFRQPRPKKPDDSNDKKADPALQSQPKKPDDNGDKKATIDNGDKK